MYTIQYSFCGNMVLATPTKFKTELEARSYIDKSLDKTIPYIISFEDESLFGFKEYWENKLCKGGC